MRDVKDKKGEKLKKNIYINMLYVIYLCIYFFNFSPFLSFTSRIRSWQIVPRLSKHVICLHNTQYMVCIKLK